MRMKYVILRCQSDAILNNYIVYFGDLMWRMAEDGGGGSGCHQRVIRVKTIEIYHHSRMESHAASATDEGRGKLAQKDMHRLYWLSIRRRMSIAVVTHWLAFSRSIIDLVKYPS